MSSGLVNPPRPQRAHGSQETGPPPWRAPWPNSTLVAVCFGSIEAILVAVYRNFLDPRGDLFPLVQLPAHLLAWEERREVATILLLAGTARLMTRRGIPAWAAFFFLFAVWDLAYYATLRLVLGWPRSASAWDLLFLVPTAWLGPVYAPVLASIVLLGVGTLTLRFAARHGGFRIGPGHAIAAVAGGGLGVWSFVADSGGRALQSLPPRYPVEFLLAGLAIGIAAYMHAYRANLRRVAAAASPQQ